MSDPNGWVSSPPSTLVKVVNTTRENLNGKFAVVLAYQEDRARYVVHMTLTQQQVSLKADNLQKASYLDQMRGQMELFQNNADVQRQLGQITSRIQAAAGGMELKYVFGLFGIAILAIIYTIGFSKAFLLLSFVILAGIVIAPDLQAGASSQQILQNLPMRVRAVIRQQVPYYGDRIADNKYYTAALVGLVLFMFVNALYSGGRTAVPRSSSTAGASSDSWLSPNRLLQAVGLGGGAASGATTDTAIDGPATTQSIAKPYLSKKGLLEDAYKRGFDDSAEGKEFGFSLDELLKREDEKIQAAATTTTASADEFASYDDYGVPPPPPPKSSSLLSASSMFSMLYIGKTLYSAGQTADHGFDVQLMIANLRTMDTLRLGMLGFSMYRLLSGVLF